MTAQAQPLILRPATFESLAGLSASASLYAVVDACDTPAVPEKAASCGAGQAFCLFDDEHREATAAAGPYLFLINPSVLHWLRETLWAEPWGVLLACKLPIATVAAHLRRFLVVQLPDGKRRSFRFYDPRILKPFLESSTRHQLRTFHGPLKAYGVGAAEGAEFFHEDPQSAAGANPNLFTQDGLFPISPSQMDRFQQMVDDQFAAELVAHMQDKHAADVTEWPEDLCRARAGTAISRARSYGIETPGAVRTFLSLMIQVGPNFDRHPPVAAILNDQLIEEAMRPNAAIGKVPGREWAAAKTARDDAAWNIPHWEAVR